MNIDEQKLKNIDIKDKKSYKKENKVVNDDIKDTMIHDEEINFQGRKKKAKIYNGEKIFSDDIEVLKIG